MSTFIEIGSRAIAWGWIPPEAREQLEEAFTHSNPEWGKQARYGGNVAKSIPKVIKTYRAALASFSVPRGKVVLLRDTLVGFGAHPRIVDLRNEGEPLPSSWLEAGRHLLEGHTRDGRPLHEHQLAIRDLLVNRENVLVRSPTASGKTIAELAAIIAAGRQALVLVPTVELAKQWQRDAECELQLNTGRVGMIGDGVYDLQPVTVCLPMSLLKHLSELPNIGTLVVDEVQTAAAQTFSDVVDKCPSKYRLGVSADERRKDKLEFLIHEAFGRCALDVKRDDLIAKGIILDVEIRMLPTTFDCEDYRMVRARARELQSKAKGGERIGRHTAKRMKLDELAAFNDLLQRMQADAERNAVVRGAVVRAVEDGGQVLVFAERREHAKQLHGEVCERLNTTSVGLMLGGKVDQAAFDRSRRGILDGTVKVSVGTYRATGVGINLPSVSNAVCATPCHSNRPYFGQVRGRVSRKGGGPVAVVWYVWDHRVFGRAPLDAMLAWNRTVKVRAGDGSWVNAREVGADAALAVAFEGTER